MISIDETDESVPELPGTPVPLSVLLPASQPPSYVADDLPSIIRGIEDSVNAIPEGADGAIVGQWSREKWIGAVIVKTPGTNPIFSNWYVKAWIGQEDGKKLDYGVGAFKTFKF